MFDIHQGGVTLKSRFLEEAKQLPLLENACGDVPSGQRRLLIAPKNFACIDAMDAKNRVFQMTVSDSHTINASALVELAEAMGATEQQPIHFFTVVPAELFSTYRSGQPLVAKGEGADDVKERASKLIRQHVLTWVSRKRA